MKFRIVARRVGLAAFAIGLCGTAFAQSTTWINAAGGTWQTAPGNWNNGVPTNLTNALFSLPAAYTVNFAGTGTAAALNMSNGTVTFALNGATLTVGTINLGGASSRLNWQAGTIHITSSNTQIAPTLIAGEGNLGANVVLDSGKNLRCSQFLGIGNTAGSATLTVTNGGSASISFMDIASNTAGLGTGTGALVVGGGSAPSVFNVNGFIAVGGDFNIPGGRGIVEVQTNGLLQLGGAMKIQPTAGSMVRLVGGTLAVATLNTGGATSRFYDHWTAGTLQVNSTGFIVSSGATAPLGNTIDIGIGKTLIVGGMTIGTITTGAGTVMVRNGGHVAVSTNLNVGVNSGNGTLIVQDAGSSLAVGGLIAVGSGGTSGTFTLQNAAVASSDTGIVIANTLSNNSQGTLLVQSGASLTTPRLDMAAASAVVTGVVASATFDNATVQVNGPLSLAGTASTAGNGTATLSILGSSNVTVSEGARVWNNGAIIFNGRTLAVGTLQTDGVATRFQWTAGTLEVNDSNVTVGTAGFLGASPVIGLGKHLRVIDRPLGAQTGTLSIPTNATLTINSGGTVTAETVAIPAGLLALSGGRLTVGTFGSTGGLFQFNSGTAAFINTLEIGQSNYFTESFNSAGRNLLVAGTLSVVNGRTLTTSGGFVGAATLDIANGATLQLGPGDLDVPNLVRNNGLVTGNGKISGALLNNAQVTLTSAPQVVTVTSGVTNNGSINLLGGGVLQLESSVLTNNASGRVFGQNGSIFAATIINNGSMSFTGGPSNLFGAVVNTGSISVSGSGILTVNGDVTLGGGSFVVSTSSEVTINGRVDGSGTITQSSGDTTLERFRVNAVNLSGGTLSVPQGGADRTSRTLSLDINQANNARLDLADHSLVVEFTTISPIESLFQDIRSAYANGSWSGPGLLTSEGDVSEFALGYAEADEIFSIFPATFQGVSVDASSVLVRFTRYGDANLDGTTNIADFSTLAANFNSGDGPEIRRRWPEGDFNYDGFVNIGDFALLSGNFNASVAAFSREVVPEPVAAAFGLATLLFLHRTRRRA